MLLLLVLLGSSILSFAIGSTVNKVDEDGVIKRNYYDKEIDLEPVGEWVLTVPYASGSNVLPFEDDEEGGGGGGGIVVKRKDRIGDTIVYVLRGKDSKLSAALATNSVEYQNLCRQRQKKSFFPLFFFFFTKRKKQTLVRIRSSKPCREN
jgi:hypothetical protein